MSEKKFLKLNLDFIVAEIRGVFGSVGMYACVCKSKSWPLLFFVPQRPNFEWYPRPFWSQKYTPDCRKSHLIFQNFMGEAPQTSRSVRGFAPLPPPFQNSWIRPWVYRLFGMGKLEWLGYNLVKVEWRSTQSFRHNTSMWQTHRQTDTSP